LKYLEICFGKGIFMYEPSGDHFANFNLAFLWPAFAAASISEITANAAKQFADLAVSSDGVVPDEPKWATANKLALELNTVRLRDFSVSSEGSPTLICAPLASHSSVLADLAPGHSLVMALRRAGLSRLFVADWRSAAAEMRFHGIDDYLADLNVLVDQIGAPVHLVGLCQGGWMALIYAARFPQKVNKLVLAGAPIDLMAAPSPLSNLADMLPLELFRDLLRIGNGLVPGRKVMKFWAVETLRDQDIREVLQTEDPAGSIAYTALLTTFRAWYSWSLDLPATYFLEVVEKLYKHNELALGKFVALGKIIDLAALKVPTFFLAARDDELVALPQLLAGERLISSDRSDLRTAIAPGGHISLFVGKRTLSDIWPQIVLWLAKCTASH
jgi:poly(3-hydroxybutyrate) depolymerase